MKNALLNLRSLASMIKRENLYIFLDFDGTLSPIAPTPGEAILPADTKKILNKLAAMRGVIVSLISGRGINDLKKKAGVKGILYSGNHGMEIEGKGIAFRRVVSEAERTETGKIKSMAAAACSGLKGVKVEDKGGSITVHYRLAGVMDSAILKKRMMFLKDRLKKHGLYFIRKGKKSFEVIPVNGWNKGMAVLLIIEKFRKMRGIRDFGAIYIGDDRTDRDAFKVLKGDGAGVFVGKSKNGYGADFSVKDTMEAAQFLKKIIELREE